MYIKKSRIIIGVIAIVLLSAIITSHILNPFGFENYSKFIKFVTTSKVIDALYYEDFDKSEAAEYAISGVASSTNDPYTQYIWGDEAKEYLEDIKGDYCGVGLYIEKDYEENLISVLAPIPGSVADNAGIITGDKILAIDGVYFTGDELTEAASTMRGEEGTDVTVLIRTKGGEEREITLKRSRIVLDNVNGQMIDNEVGYIALTQFTDGTSEEFVKELESLIEKGMKSLIVDLRNNPGGLLDDAIEIVSCFVEEGKLVTYTEDKSKRRTEFCAIDSSFRFESEKPVYILINGSSASASEVMTGALKDYGIAKVVGEKSFGKGVVQNVISIGEDILSVTISKYFSPNGICIHGEGIEPDVVIEMPPEKVPVSGNIDLNNDEQLLAVIDLIRN